MAGTYHITPIRQIGPPINIPGVPILEELETTSIDYHPQSEKSVKRGCCGCIRRRKNDVGSCLRRAQLRLAATAEVAQMKLYLRYTWIDSLMLCIFGIIILGLYWIPINPRRVPLLPIWPAGPVTANSIVNFSDLRAPTEFQYRYQKSPLNDIVCAVLLIVVPIIVVALFQIKLRSTWDFYAGHVGILRAVTTTAVFVSILKHCVGGLRPHFIDVCVPNKTMVAEYIQRHYQGLENHNLFNATICTGRKELVKTALQSFPSGHAANAFAAAVFLTLYMNAKLKVIGDHCSHYWAFFITILPLLLASILSAEMYNTHQHHMRDIFAGMILGLVLGTLAYRSVYAAFFDARYNHIPLPFFSSQTQFFYSRDRRTMSPDEVELNGNVNKLVVWRWWKSSATQEAKGREETWLRDIRKSPQHCGPLLSTDANLRQEEGQVSTMERVEQRLQASRPASVASTGPAEVTRPPTPCCV